ncbi:MAG: hypothetical protein ACRCSI_09775, partial [Eubacterium aggregans]
ERSGPLRAVHYNALRAAPSTRLQPHQTQRVCALTTEGLHCICQRQGSEANLLNGGPSRATPPLLG